MNLFLRKIKWFLTGRPMISYRGFNCGLCGKWIIKSFSIPTWKSVGKWGDTWGICSQHGKKEIQPALDY